MCGIVGYIGEKNASQILHGNLKRLEYRGYDSCGIVVMGKKLQVKKGAGTIDEVHEKIDLDSLTGNVGIGHTRWATHGTVTDANAHPHLDCKGEIALVHNGIISNYLELKKKLQKKGHKFKSETDTECLVHLIEEKHKRNGIEAAVRDALSEVKGTYAVLVFSSREPDKLVCARNESPLLLGIGQGEMFVGSDVTSFLQFTKKAIPLDDGEYAVVTQDKYEIRRISDGCKIAKKPIEIKWSIEAAEKEGHPHFMLKEILEQPQTIVNALNIYPEEIVKLAKMINSASTVYLTAAGTSLHAAMVAEYWFSQMCGKLVISMDSSELLSKGVIDSKTLVIGITQSGETYDTLSAMRHAKGKGAKIAAIVNVVGSTATRLADHVIMQGSGIEISVCATKTFTSQLVVLLRVALELGKILGKDVGSIEKELLVASNLVGAVVQHREDVKKIADDYFAVRNYLYIGKGINLPSALEGALKFKEITYNHAEGMSGGLLKHGTISLIDSDFHTIAIVPAKGENRTKIKSNIQEVKARKGLVVGIVSGNPVEGCDANVLVPECSEMISPIVMAPAYQLLAYYTAVKLGRSVDKPRALAKSVTVE